MVKGLYLGLGCIFLFIPGCGLFDHKADKAIMVVGSRCLTADSLKREMQYVLGGIPVPVQDAEQIKKQLVELIIDRYLIMEYGREKGILVSEGEFQKKIKGIMEEYTENDFQQELVRGYVDFDLLKLRLREQLLVSKVINKVSEDVAAPSYEEIKRYFQENPDEFRSPEMVRARQIVTKTKKEAIKLRNRLRAGEEMGELAKRYSIAPEAEDGGQMGWVARGDLPRSMEKALFSTPKGRIGPIIKTSFGYHLFEVIASRPAGVKALLLVMSEIESRLIRQRREVTCKKWLKRLRSSFKIKVDQDMLRRLELS